MLTSIMTCISHLITLLLTFPVVATLQANYISAESSLKVSNDAEQLVQPKIWALIAAGSYEWINYRHQADACHAFHLLKSHGIPEERIILMMYDDIAYHKSNPNPGVIINQPNGSNVYEGVRVDYRGNDVTPENFLAILQGDMKSVRGGSGRVIASSASDHIFVYFVDHGATGLIQFPNSILTVKQLNDALRLMHAKHQYKRVVFFMEACEGGSMFNNILPKNINVYAVTSANEKESAWACYCDNDREGLPCLGDVFSVSWMGNADSRDLKSEKLKTQVEIAREATTSSHVMEYGNMSIGNLSAANFEGSKSVFADSLQPKKTIISSIMPVREIPFITLKRKLRTLRKSHERSALRHQIKIMLMKRTYLKTFFTELVSTLVGDRSAQKRLLNEYPVSITNLHCYDDVIRAFHTSCFNFNNNSYALKYAYVLANICEERIPTNIILQKLLIQCLDIQHDNIY